MMIERIQETNGHGLPRTPSLTGADPLGAAMDALIQLLAEGEPASMQLVRNGWRAVLKVQRVDDPAPAVPPRKIESTPPDDTKPTEDAILDVLRKADSPIKTTTIALRGKLNLNSSFRECVAGLVQRRLIERIGGCKYQIASTAPAIPADTPTLNDDDESRLPPCRQVLLRMFRTAKRRMTAGQAHQWLRDHGGDYALSSVIKNLSELKNDGKIDNCSDGYGVGYGLPEWSRIAADPRPDDDDGPSSPNSRIEVLHMFGEVDERMTAGRAQLWLKDHGKEYSLSTVEKCLHGLKVDGLLNNTSDHFGKGYGLARWSAVAEDDD
jgi:Fe2+ or Zn2+ uptake regulation protein